MPIVAQIDTAELEGLALQVGAHRKTMERAARTAANRAIRWARSQVARGVAGRIGAPQSALKSRIKAKKATPSDPRAHVWVGLNPLNIERLGARKTSRGLRAGKRDYPGAFVAPGRYGGRIAYRRQGRKRLPIDAVVVDLYKEAPDILRRDSWPALQAKFLGYYRQELDRRMR